MFYQIEKKNKNKAIARNLVFIQFDNFYLKNGMCVYVYERGGIKFQIHFEIKFAELICKEMALNNYYFVQ